MEKFFDFLTGNVPGGIGLYSFVILVIFLVLYSISRKNDLFTPKHFKIWFMAIWLIATMIYFFFWIGNPPPAVFTRYTTQISAEEKENYWLAYYFRDEISQHLKPFKSSTNYLYLQRWIYFTGFNFSEVPIQKYQFLAEKLPLNKVIAGQISRDNQKYFLTLSLKKYPNPQNSPIQKFEFIPSAPDQIIPGILAWLKPHFPLNKNKLNPSLVDKHIILAKEAFYRHNYQKSRELCRLALQKYPQNKEVLKWEAYSRIRLAGDSQTKNKSGNPYKTKKALWEKELESARIVLLHMAKHNFENKIEDVMLNNMIAENFMLDGLFGDAEEFLKIAFGENPFSMEVLENLALLHPSRYEGLPFSDEMNLYARILNICPVNENILTKYVDRLLLNVQITDGQSKEIKSRIGRVLAINPYSIKALILQGKFLNLTFKYEDALKFFLKADSIKPDYALLQYNVGVTYYKLKKLESAEIFFNKAIQLSDYLDAHLYLGVIYKNRGQYNKALEHFRYRVAHKKSDDDYYAIQAMKGIRECLKALNISIPQ